MIWNCPTWNYAADIGRDLGLLSKGTWGSWALFSPDLIYRYALGRVWDERPILLVCGLNPSTADHETTDPTLRKLLHFAKRDGYGGLILVNVAAFRAVKPFNILHCLDPVGERNSEVIRRALDKAPLVGRTVAAWGAPKWNAIRPLIRLARTTGARRTWNHCFGVTKDGHPRHPLYLRNDAAIREWTDEARRAVA